MGEGVEGEEEGGGGGAGGGCSPTMEKRSTRQVWAEAGRRPAKPGSKGRRTARRCQSEWALGEREAGVRLERRWAAKVVSEAKAVTTRNWAAVPRRGVGTVRVGEAEKEVAQSRRRWRSRPRVQRCMSQRSTARERRKTARRTEKVQRENGVGAGGMEGLGVDYTRRWGKHK